MVSDAGAPAKMEVTGNHRSRHYDFSSRSARGTFYRPRKRPSYDFRRDGNRPFSVLAMGFERPTMVLGNGVGYCRPSLSAFVVGSLDHKVDTRGHFNAFCHGGCTAHFESL